VSASTLDVVLPVHNEGLTIARTLEEFHQVATRHGLSVRFVVCEDGSTDDTVLVLEGLRARLPLALVTAKQRKGYSRAAMDGLRAAESEWVGFVDADGQCDPADLPTLLAATAGVDLVIGSRSPRQDPLVRLAMSAAFRAVYRRLFAVPLKDPSSPYLLVRKAALARLFEGRVGLLKQGFWWEFYARAYAAGLHVREVPIHHRHRAAGSTQVFRPSRVPRIAVEHLLGLLALRRELGRVHH
jgi:dolichol-phosphate mannosyltransferase